MLARVKPVVENKSPIERIPVEKGGRKVLIPVDQIRYIMAKDDYSCIFTEDDRYLSTTSLAQFESKLVRFRLLPRASPLHREPRLRGGRGDGCLRRIQLGVTGVDDRIPVSRRRVVPLTKALNL